MHRGDITIAGAIIRDATVVQVVLQDASVKCMLHLLLTQKGKVEDGRGQHFVVRVLVSTMKRAISSTQVHIVTVMRVDDVSLCAPLATI
jgi:hypothetical protein